MFCPKCGKENNDDAKFCGGCGIKLSKPGVCPKCGAAVKPSDDFCSECGEALNEVRGNKATNENKKFSFFNLFLPIMGIVLPLLVLLFGAFTLFDNYVLDTYSVNLYNSVGFVNYSLLLALFAGMIFVGVLAIIKRTAIIQLISDVFQAFVILFVTILMTYLTVNLNATGIAIILLVLLFLSVIAYIIIMSFKTYLRKYED